MSVSAGSQPAKVNKAEVQSIRPYPYYLIKDINDNWHNGQQNPVPTVKTLGTREVFEIETKGETLTSK